MRGLDAGVIVVDTDLKVRSWNRWSENVWGLREDEAIDQPFGALDIGLPVQRDWIRHSRRRRPDGVVSDATLDALDRRGRR